MDSVLVKYLVYPQYGHDASDLLRLFRLMRFLRLELFVNVQYTVVYLDHRYQIIFAFKLIKNNRMKNNNKHFFIVLNLNPVPIK